jgi:hypothetical protein
MKKINFKLPEIKIYGIDVIKNFLLFILFLILTLISLYLFIAPSIKNFKETKNNYYKIKTKFKKTKQTYQHNIKTLKYLQIENKNITNAFNKDFNIKHFKFFSKNYINLASIKEINKTKKDCFIQTNYEIQAFIHDPKEFYNFIKASQNYESIIKISMPILFEKKGKKIFIKFQIKHYKLSK